MAAMRWHGSARHRRRLTLVSRLSGCPVVYAPAGDRRQEARPSTAHEGGEVAHPGGHRGGDRTGGTDGLQCLLVRQRPARHRGGDCHGQLVSQRRGVGPAARWVFVRDRTGTHRDDYLFSTDPEMAVAPVVETYTGRWSIETTLQEMRAYLGLETTRGWKEATVLRLAPCLFGLFSVVAVLYALLPVWCGPRAGWHGRARSRPPSPMPSRR